MAQWTGRVGVGGKKPGAAPYPGSMKHWTLGVLIACASLAPAEGGAREPGECRFEAGAALDEDANGDGQVTLLEARAAALAMFEHFDRDGDGMVVRSEVEAGAGSWRERRLAVRFAALDRDRDGGLSRAELALPAGRFARADGDGDGRLSRAELAQAFERGARGGAGTAALRSRFWRRDLNRDGRVTRAEALAAADQRFLRRDRDGDGVVRRGGERRAGR